MDDIILKKKDKTIKNNNYNNKKYLYFSIMGLFLLIGVSYALIFFMERFQGSELGFSTDLLDVSISENGLVTIDNANTQKDTEGINNDKTTFTIVNNNRVPIRVIIKLVEEHNSNLSLDSVRFGVLGGGEILNVDSLGNTDSVLYDFFMEPGQTATLESTLWLDYYYEGGSISEIFSGKYVVEASNANQFAYSYLSDLVGKDKGLYAINEDGTLNSGTGTVKEYRYSGLMPDNYVYFNGEVWRIISVSNDGLLKIVRNEEITMANYPGNEEYYESLDKDYQEYVLNTTFNTGGVSLTDTYTTLLTNESSSTTEGYVNYINASDYLYSTATTYYTSALNSTNISSNTWLYGTYLTANGISGSENVLGINQNIPTSATSTDETYRIRPCLYLKKTVSIVEGYGTLEQPYVLDYADVKELKIVKNVMNTFPTTITNNKDNISEVRFVRISEDDILNLNIETIDLTYNDQGRVIAWFEEDSNDATKDILHIGSNGTIYLTTGISLFYEWTNLTTIVFENVSMEDVTDMSNMFMKCFSLTTLNVSDWNVSNVTKMNSMFLECSSLTTLDVSNWNVGNVTDMSYMFAFAEALSALDVSDWDVGNVTNMAYMFGFNFAMSELDLINWNVSSATDMSYMFAYASLTKIYSNSNWQQTAVNLNNSVSMFEGCYSLAGSNAFFNETLIDIQMANPDTGYFTRKNS